MGQQHRVQIKRKRRRAYLQRKKASQRAAKPRPAPARQQAQKIRSGGVILIRSLRHSERSAVTISLTLRFSEVACASITVTEGPRVASPG